MNKEELATKLNGRQYREEMTREEEQLAKENGLIVIFGQSDDLVEFRGVIHDEISGYEGADFIIVIPGTEIPKDENEDTFYRAKQYEAIPIEEESITKKNRFKADWDPEDLDCSWRISSLKTPHGSFDILEDSELYCRGIIVDINDLQ